MRKATLVLLLVGFSCASAFALNGAYRTSATEKGSILVWPKIEVRWDQDGNLIQDTFVTINNDYQDDVRVHLFFVSDTCTNRDNELVLTENDPAYWSVATGLPLGCSPFTVVATPYLEDPNDPDSDYILRGYVVGFAVNATDEPICWNHLFGTASIVHYGNSDVAAYNAYAFAARSPTPNGNGCTGLVVGPVGTLNLNGTQYDYGFNYLLLDFFASGSHAFAGGGVDVLHDTKLALMILSQDFRTDDVIPYITQIQFDRIWNENELGMSGQEYCLVKWSERYLSDIGGYFLLQNLQTNKGYARIYGREAVFPQCPLSGDYSLLGVATEWLEFGDPEIATAALNLFGAGTDDAVIYWDGTSPSEEKLPKPGKPRMSAPQAAPLGPIVQ